MLSKFVVVSAIVLSCLPMVGCSDQIKLGIFNPPEDITAGNPAPTAQQSGLTSCVNSGGEWVSTDGGQGFCSYIKNAKTAGGTAGK